MCARFRLQIEPRVPDLPERPHEPLEPRTPERPEPAEPPTTPHPTVVPEPMAPPEVVPPRGGRVALRTDPRSAGPSVWRGLADPVSRGPSQAGVAGLAKPCDSVAPG